MEVTISLIDALNRLLGRIGGILITLCTLLVFTVVVLRYALDSGSIALQESGLWLHAAAFLLAAAWTLRQDGHVRVDVFYQRFSARQKAWVELLGGLFLLLPFCLFILITSWDYAAASWAVHEASPETGGLPGQFILKSIIPLAAISLLLQGLAQLLRALRQLLDSPAAA
ncbi:MAG: hypothetical protein Tsb002_25840 [Wenzhouxiangellaceae bacterium]